MTDTKIPGAKLYDVLIVGGGPAGLAVGLSASFEGLSTVVVDRNETGFGGAIHETAFIENLPGFPDGITGEEFGNRLKAHANKNGAELVSPANVTDIEQRDNTFVVTFDDGGQLVARTVVLATGVQSVRLNARGVSEFLGCGVSYSPPHTNRIYENEEFHMVGAGNSAAIAANFLASQPGCSVTMLVRAESLAKTMSSLLIQKLQAKTNVRFRFQTEVIEAKGNQKLEKLILKGPRGIEEVASRCLYVYIGTTPKTAWLNGKSIARNERGFLLTGYDIPAGMLGGLKPIEFQTSWPGVFAIGTGRWGCSPRAASATGEGAQIVKAILEYLTH